MNIDRRVGETADARHGARRSWPDQDREGRSDEVRQGQGPGHRNSRPAHGLTGRRSSLALSETNIKFPSQYPQSTTWGRKCNMRGRGLAEKQEAPARDPGKCLSRHRRPVGRPETACVLRDRRPTHPGAAEGQARGRPERRPGPGRSPITARSPLPGGRRRRPACQLSRRRRQPPRGRVR